MAGRVLRWLVPGLGVKRWMLVILAGITLLAVGTGIFLLDLYRTDTHNPFILSLLALLSLRFLPRLARVLVFGALGAGFVGYGIWRLESRLSAAVCTARGTARRPAHHVSSP